MGTDYTKRFFDTPPLSMASDTDYRSEYSRDYARVLHSPSFRRLQSKTQLFPGGENDFFRNRLTHSLEVSQIAKSIAKKLKAENPDLDIIPEVCEIAGLIHDIGHPPFGHNGESALDDCMLAYGGFEGNAQTLRIITRLEKKESVKDVLDKDGRDCRVGLNLTARSIASALKYDRCIPISRKTGRSLVKGYYDSEKDVVKKVKECVVGTSNIAKGSFKTIECGIMDLADDIAYSTYDMEDAFKADFLTPLDMLSRDDDTFYLISEKLKKDNFDVSPDQCREALIDVFAGIFVESVNYQKGVVVNEDFFKNTLASFIMAYQTSKLLAKDGYYRTSFTSRLVNYFINGVRIEINKQYPILSKVYMDKETALRVNVLKHFAYVVLINSSRLKVAESRGEEIIKKMFKKIYGEKRESDLLPEDVKKLYTLSDDELWRARVICDFISGMTDRYALEFYGRLFSENPQTIFKPL